jgi:hypothetical protein
VQYLMTPFYLLIYTYINVYRLIIHNSNI